MCTPEIQAAAAVGSMFMSVTSNIQQGRFSKSTAEYNARVNQNQAQEVRNQGVEAENIQRRKTAELQSKQRAQLGAAGVDLGSGSPLQLLTDTERLGEIDALRIRSNTESQAQALETGASLINAQGGYARTAGNNAAVGSVLTGVSDFIDTGVADKWYQPDSAANEVDVSGIGYSDNNVTAIPLRD